MKENFSKGVQKVLKYAKEEAVRLGHSYVGSEHLLLGILKDKKYFIANKILAKHDENYMPPEVSKALEKSN